MQLASHSLHCVEKGGSNVCIDTHDIVLYPSGQMGVFQDILSACVCVVFFFTYM